MTPRIAFIHIPKTAGSQLVEKVINLWPRDQVSPHPGQPGFMRDGPARCREYHFTAGHVFYPIMKDLLHPDTKWMTMLRDPIERSYSHYNHLRKFEQTLATSFEDFVYVSANRPLANNLQAKHLAWWPKGFQGIPEHTSVIEHMAFDITDSELYDRAMENLNTFWHVGIQETGFVQAVEAIYMEHNCTLPAGIVQKESRDYRNRMSTKLVGDLEELNAVDRELYEYFKERIDGNLL
jgi:hypothetical protein